MSVEKFNGGATGDSGTGTAKLTLNAGVGQSTTSEELTEFDPMGSDTTGYIPVSGLVVLPSVDGWTPGSIGLRQNADGSRDVVFMPLDEDLENTVWAFDQCLMATVGTTTAAQYNAIESHFASGEPIFAQNSTKSLMLTLFQRNAIASSEHSDYAFKMIDSQGAFIIQTCSPVLDEDDEVTGCTWTQSQITPGGSGSVVITSKGTTAEAYNDIKTNGIIGAQVTLLNQTTALGYLVGRTTHENPTFAFFATSGGSAGIWTCTPDVETGTVSSCSWSFSTFLSGASSLNSLIGTEAPIQKKLENNQVVIYEDPKEASPLENIETPSIELLNSNAGLDQGGGHGNQWSSAQGHLFSLPNYFVPTLTDTIGTILTNVQSGTVDTIYCAIYEIDETAHQMHLVCMGSNMASNGSSPSTTGLHTTALRYIDSTYNVIKPGKMYYAVKFCDQTALTFASVTASTLNLHPSNNLPVGWATNQFNSQNITNTDLENIANNLKTVDYTTFGMSANRLYMTLKHNS